MAITAGKRRIIVNLIYALFLNILDFLTKDIYNFNQSILSENIDKIN